VIDGGGSPGSRAFVDLHVHTSASFDSLASPESQVKAAATRGLTHIAITDHDTIDGALAARDYVAREGLDIGILVGQEVRTSSGDLIAVFLTEAIESGLAPADAIAAIRAQGGLVGIPHPFDKFRGSMLTDPRLEAMAQLVDWVEAHNARLVGHGNEDAALFARDNDLPGIAVSDAHSVMEIGVAYMALDGDPSTAAGLLAALPTLEIVPGRASYFVRLWTPIAKGVNRLRGNGRIRPVASDGRQ